MKKFVLATLLLVFPLIAESTGLRILFIGDSITDGNWGNSNGGAQPSNQRSLWDMNHIYGHGFMYLCASYYQSKYPQKEYVFMNRGISGNTLSDMQNRWENDAIANKPDVISILIGTNDINTYLNEKRTTPFDFKDWEERYCNVIDRTLKDNPKVKFILCSPFTANTGNMRKSKNFAERDSLLRKCAAITKRIALRYHTIYLPLNTMFDKILKDEPTTQNAYWIWDGIHPTAAGHQRIFQMWVKEVDKAGYLK